MYIVLHFRNIFENVLDPTLAKQLLIFCNSNTHQFGKGSNLGLISDRIIGQGILLADGERWSKQRRVSAAPHPRADLRGY